MVGCTLVGCVSGMGGGTLNNLMYGATPVYWMASPHWLGMCVASCVVTFYGWPLLEERLSSDQVSSPPRGKPHHPGSTLSI